MNHAFWTVLLPLLLLAGCGTDSQRASFTGVMEGRTVQVPALTGGEVVEMFVDTGDEVRAGDTLAVVDTAELVLELKQVLANLEELEVQEEIAATDLSRTEADLSYVKEKQGRVKALYEKEVAARQNLDDLLNETQRAESAFQTARQRSRSLAARRKQLEAQVGLLEKKMSDAIILAPMDGLVGTRYFEKGEAVPPLRSIVELIRVNEMEVKIYVPEKMLPMIKHDQKAQIRVDGLEGTLQGRLSWVSPKAEFTPKTILTPETRTSLVYAVKVIVPNPNRVLKHGMPVEVILQTAVESGR
ncbi:MAG: efflux RND transporter periplasmic adaptor subunit [Candidatus Eiseniibacteriota bacterium]|nr:MAG: efflux RND transporter periplasmic adaptor subunit [Candidatus Eisenbacteria bacterium]